MASYVNDLFPFLLEEKVLEMYMVFFIKCVIYAKGSLDSIIFRCKNTYLSVLSRCFSDLVLDPVREDLALNIK